MVNRSACANQLSSAVRIDERVILAGSGSPCCSIFAVRSLVEFEEIETDHGRPATVAAQADNVRFGSTGPVPPSFLSGQLDSKHDSTGRNHLQ